MKIVELEKLDGLLKKYCTFIKDARGRAKNSCDFYIKKYIAEDFTDIIGRAMRTQHDVEFTITVLKRSAKEKTLEGKRER